MDTDAPGSIDAAAEWLRKRFACEAARGFRARYQLELSGPSGGLLWLNVDDGELEIVVGARREADVKLRLAAKDAYGVLAGNENSELLFMAGRLEVEGDASLALRLRTFFRRRA